MSTDKIKQHKTQKSNLHIPGVKNTIAVASGKGGVGKSTVAASLALALQAQGASVALLDADIYGPSLPSLLQTVASKPETIAANKLKPVIKYNLQTMSIGYLLPQDDAPIVWRGPMVTRSLQQLLMQTAWQDVDYLIIDLPPGTGDIQITLVQQIPLTAAIIVTTPQELALVDAAKAINMFNKVNVSILGIIENMSFNICGNCHSQQELFGSGGAEELAAKYQTNVLAKLALDINIRQALDDGKCAACFIDVAAAIQKSLAQIPEDHAHKFPNIIVE